MRHLIPFLCALATVACVPIDPDNAGGFGNSLRAGWGGSSCSSVEGRTFYQYPIQTAPNYHWQELGSAEQIQLLDGERHVGTFWLSTGKYYRRFGQGWETEPSPCPVTTPRYRARFVSDEPQSKSLRTLPIPAKDLGRKTQKSDENMHKIMHGDLPDNRTMERVLCHCSNGCQCGPDDCQCAKGKKICNDGCNCCVADVPNYGVDQGKIHTEPGGRYTINGREITADEAHKAVISADGTLPDDSKLLRLTMIGTEADNAKVLSDLASNAALAPFKDKVLVQSYKAGDPATDVIIKRCGFVCDGAPSIYVQLPDGKVRHRQNVYQGPVKLAEALRKADPAYDPAHDPDLTQPKPDPKQPDQPSPGPVSGGNTFLAILGAIVAAIALWSKK